MDEAGIENLPSPPDFCRNGKTLKPRSEKPDYNWKRLYLRASLKTLIGALRKFGLAAYTRIPLARGYGYI